MHTVHTTATHHTRGVQEFLSSEGRVARDSAERHDHLVHVMVQRLHRRRPGERPRPLQEGRLCCHCWRSLCREPQRRLCHRAWEVCYGEGYRGRPSPDQWQLRHIHPPRGEVRSVLEPNADGMCVVTVGMWCEGDGSKQQAF